MKKHIINQINNLPPLPNNIRELDNFRKKDSTNVEELLEILKKDPLIVANILKVANSSMFGFRSKVETLSRAINLLGIKFAISIAIGSSINESIKSNLLAYAVTNDDFLFSCSLATNIVNTWISTINFDLKNELLLPAFLQEIGKFVISQAIQNEKKTEEFLKELEETKDTSYCEETFTGFTCARITANIFKNWQLSHNIIFPIAFAEDIENCPKEFQQKAQILQIIKILCDVRYPLSDKNIEKALEKVALYNFDVENFLNSIDVIKAVIEENT
ncbi:HDOD domain-containing protein [Arcobacter aquimarinus]|uniref:HDOD domain-containing protein n=1 Tax=Arcobacter aquimarinus TaxID=1315211 RepID=UPI00100BE6D1|nr:HDOD domain-containing protein [Arcobacter aquimarinus]RXI35372.1 HDOD domain-containing protein [Arcobacter aquimarinus]